MNDRPVRIQVFSPSQRSWTASRRRRCCRSIRRSVLRRQDAEVDTLFVKIRLVSFKNVQSLKHWNHWRFKTRVINHSLGQENWLERSVVLDSKRLRSSTNSSSWKYNWTQRELSSAEWPTSRAWMKSSYWATALKFFKRSQIQNLLVVVVSSFDNVSGSASGQVEQSPLLERQRRDLLDVQGFQHRNELWNKRILDSNRGPWT